MAGCPHPFDKSGIISILRLFKPNLDLIQINTIKCEYVAKYYKKMAATICLLFGLGSKEADDLTKHLSLMAKTQWEFDMVFEFLEEQFDVAFESMEEYNQFLAVYTEMSNHTRIWENCGYSPAQSRTRMRTL